MNNVHDGVYGPLGIHLLDDVGHRNDGPPLRSFEVRVDVAEVNGGPDLAIRFAYEV